MAEPIVEGLPEGITVSRIPTGGYAIAWMECLLGVKNTRAEVIDTLRDWGVDVA